MGGERLRVGTVRRIDRVLSWEPSDLNPLKELHRSLNLLVDDRPHATSEYVLIYEGNETLPVAKVLSERDVPAFPRSFVTAKLNGGLQTLLRALTSRTRKMR